MEQLRDDASELGAPCSQRSGRVHRPIHGVQRSAAQSDDAQTRLEEYKVSLRRYSPVQKGLEGLPWSGEWHCARCEENAPGKLTHEPAEDAIYLKLDCPRCGSWRERQHDVLFTREAPPTRHPRQPETTRGGFPIHPVLGEWPKTVETLCPECSALILGRSFVKDSAVWMEKTCPEHGYFRDKVDSNARLRALLAQRCFEDEPGPISPHVTDANSCPTDCGLCNQHHSTPCLAQIDLSNRCNLTCPVCFASANQAGYVSEPGYEMVVETLQALRDVKPVPTSAVQFTGGEPTMHPRFFDIVRKANEMGFSHVQIASNGLLMADPEFARKAAEAGLHTVYLQFDGVKDERRRQALDCYKWLKNEDWRLQRVALGYGTACAMQESVAGQSGRQVDPHMVVRISTSKDGSATTVRVEGDLCWDDLSTLAAEVRSAGTGFALDLSGLRHADTVAVHALRELIAKGAVPQGASLYIAELLEAED